MPRVPTYDSPQVQPDALPGVREESFASPLTQRADKQVQLGNALQVAGAEGNSIAQQMQEQANQVRVDDALNKAKERVNALTFDKDEGYLNQRGSQAFDRPSGKPLADEYSEQLQKDVGGISEGLSNAAQRRTFALHANNLQTSFRGQLQKHESDQFREYTLSVRDGTIANGMDTIGKFWNDPNRIDGEVQAIQAAVVDKAKLEGKSATWAEAQSRKLTSNAHLVALEAALENQNLPYADQYLKKYANQMDANDMLRVHSIITKEMDSRIAMHVAGDAINKVAPRIATSDADRAWNIATATESGGKQFAADGSPLTSPKGAVGIAQVMPGTGPEAAKLAGLDWDEAKFRNDPKYNEAIGKAYFQKQLQSFGGSLAKGYAAYNAGPGATQEAIDKAITEGKPGNWVSHLPKETQDYVAKNMKAFGEGDGNFTRPTLQEVHAEVRTQIGDNNPRRLTIAMQEATRQFEDQQKDFKQKQDEAVSTAMRTLEKNGGRYSDLPPSIKASIPPKEVDNVLSYGQKVAKGDDITNFAVYNKLTGDPSYLKNLSDDEFYRIQKTSLSAEDAKHVQKMRADVKSSTGTNAPGELNSSAVNSVLNSRLQQLGIDPTPKDASNDAERVGAIRSYVNKSILNAQATGGKKMSDAEVQQHIDGLFAKSVGFQTTFLGMGTGRTGMRMLEMKIDDVPGDVKDKLKEDFKARGIDKPSDADLLGAYWMLKSTKPAVVAGRATQDRSH
jgi:soluble lytic murein transglycosylase